MPHADRIPRSATGSLEADTYRSLNIDIPFPLNTQSSLSMELTHDGKVLELVTRFESFTSDHDSDASQAHRDPDSVHTQSHSSNSSPCHDQSDGNLSEALDRNTVRASPARTGRVKGTLPSIQDKPGRNTRKSIPAEWKQVTRPQAPVFQTELRQEARENKRRNATHLTKHAGETMDDGIASASAPLSPTKLSRRQSKASLQSPTISSTRSSPRHSATVRINATTSPTRSSRVSMQNQGREPSATPSAASNQGTEYHSAHSPVSLVPSRVVSAKTSHESFFSAEERIMESCSVAPPQEQHHADRQFFIQPYASLNAVPHLVLRSADSVGQSAGAHGYLTRPEPHSRRKTESHINGPRVRQTATDLSLRIPTSVTQTGSLKPPFTVGSATSPTRRSSGPANKSSSRIPRVTPIHDESTKASSLRRSKSTKSLKETSTPVIYQRSHLLSSQDLWYVLCLLPKKHQIVDF